MPTPEQNKILIVEDEMIIAFDIRIRLNNAGFTNVELASTGEEAIQFAEKYRPDFVFMDLKLDGKIDGIDAANAILNKCGAKIIFLSGNHDFLNDERVLKIRPLAFLTKPIDETQLFAVLKTENYQKE